MRKCYFLNKPLLVDLYQNDLFSLEKALNYVKIHENKIFESSDLTENDDDLLKGLASALRLKFFIQAEDYPLILKTLQKSNDIPKTTYQIWMDAGILTNLSEKKLIQDKIHEFR